MFCDGKCTKGRKKCGLFLEIFMKNDVTGNEKVIEKCAIIGLFESMVRQEQGQIRIQAAVESGRNENVKCLRRQDETLATGFLGLLRFAQERSAEEEAERIEMLHIDSDEIIEGEVEDGSV
jgi:hypothetical protein